MEKPTSKNELENQRLFHESASLEWEIEDEEATNRLLEERNSLIRRKDELLQERKELISAVQGRAMGRSVLSQRSPLLSFFIDQAQHAVIFEEIYRFLEIRDILQVRRTCKDLSTFYHDLIPRKWSIDVRLSRFVNDPKEFRHQLGLADALISGSFALQFFAQQVWSDASLDVFIEDPDEIEKSANFVKYVVEKEGYVFNNVQRDWSDASDNENAIEDEDAKPVYFYKILVYQKQFQRGPPSRIKFVTLNTFPLHAILGDAAFTTDHANIISWDRAYCLFPRAVFVKKRMQILRPLTRGLGKILASYSKQGWRTSDRLTCDRKTETLQSEACSSSLGFFDKGRTLGDRNSWTITFDNQGVKDPGMPSSVLESSEFSIHWCGEYKTNRDNGYAVLQQVELIAVPVRCCALRYGYTASDGHWIRFLWRALHKFVTLEVWKVGDLDWLEKVNAWDVETDFECPILQEHTLDEFPISWEQVDHLMPRLRREYEVWRSGEFRRMSRQAQRERTT